MTTIRLDDVRAALHLANFDARDAQRRMAPQVPARSFQRSPQKPGSARQASVLLLLFPALGTLDAAVGDDLSLVLVRRSENEHDVHSGQISLPGGAQEAGETPVQTALRETCEEVGECQDVAFLGQLTTLYIPPSDFEVHPMVGYVPVRPAWRPDPAEVADVLECPLRWLLDDARKVEEDWDFNGAAIRVRWYNVHGHKVWGATAIILSEFELRLRHVLSTLR